MAVVWLRREDFDLLIHALDFVAEETAAGLDEATATRFGEIYENLTDSRDRFDGAIEAAPAPVEKPKRKRRTKAELAAEQIATDAEAIVEATGEPVSEVDAEALVNAALGTPQTVTQAELVDMAYASALNNKGGPAIFIPEIPKQTTLPGVEG